MRELSIGRNSDNNVPVDDTSVSRKHAILIISGNEYSVRDLGSTNGTYINGMRINGVSNLKTNDILKVGNALVPWMNHLELAGLKQQTVFHQGQNQGQQQYVNSSQQINLPNASGGMVCGIIGIILSLGLVGIILNIIAISLSGSAISRYKSNPEIYTESSYRKAKSGQALGIIGLSVFGLALLIIIIIIVANS